MKRAINSKQEQQQQQHFHLGGYKLTYCECEFFNKNLKCNYNYLKGQMFYKLRNI